MDHIVVVGEAQVAHLRGCVLYSLYYGGALIELGEAGAEIHACWTEISYYFVAL